MKNLIAMLLALALAFTLPLTALAEGTTAADLENDNLQAVDCELEIDSAILNGLVMGWNEDGDLLIRGAYGQMYQVHIDSETEMGDAQFLAIGDYVTVVYNGMLSRSIPAQLTASCISCFQRTGVVENVVLREDGTVESFMLKVEGEDALQVNAEYCQNDAPIYEGAAVTVYFDGMMSRSIPAQINALYIRAIQLAGQVVEITEADEEGVYGILMNDETFGEVLVWCDADTILYTELNVGEMITVATTGMMTMSIPAQTAALEVFSMAAPAL